MLTNFTTGGRSDDSSSIIDCDRTFSQEKECWSKVVVRTERATGVAVINVAMIGNSNVGKTALIKTYCARGSLRSSKLATLGVEVEPAWVAINGQVVKVKVWDTAGQERLATLTKSFIKNLDGVMLVFDITDRQSFDNTLTWYKQIIECSDIPIVFIGNKSDL